MVWFRYLVPIISVKVYVGAVIANYFNKMFPVEFHDTSFRVGLSIGFYLQGVVGIIMQARDVHQIVIYARFCYPIKLYVKIVLANRVVEGGVGSRF